MKIEFVTFFKEGSQFRVIAKAAIPHQITRWNGLAKIMASREVVVCKSSRYHTPMTEYRTVANSEQIDAHMIRTGIPGHFLEQAEEPGKRRKRCFLGFSRDSDAAGAALQALGKLGPLDDLAKFPALEAHRRVMRLERYVCFALGLGSALDGGTADELWREDLEWLRANRAKSLAREYFVFEPLSVYVPSLCSHELGQDVASTAERRLQTAVRDAWPLVRYGRRLSALLERLGSLGGTEWRLYEFDSRLDWLPPSFRVCSEKEAKWGSTEAAAPGRNEKEREDLRQALLRHKDVPPRVPSLLAELRAAGPGLLAGDTHELDRTRYLPPTASAPQAEGDPIKFLAPASAEA